MTGLGLWLGLGLEYSIEYSVCCYVCSIVPMAVTITAVCFISFSFAATIGDTRTFLVLGGTRMGPKRKDLKGFQQ